ncbi:MAG: hypothetical protein QM803_12075 [Rhodocyclaceae bacterium]
MLFHQRRVLAEAKQIGFNGVATECRHFFARHAIVNKVRRSSQRLVDQNSNARLDERVQPKALLARQG